MPLIEVTNLKYVYNAGTPEAVVALDGVSLRIERGEYLAVVGGNGSGKSTLAKHLNALLLPTAGEVWVDGLGTRDRAPGWDIRRRGGLETVRRLNASDVTVINITHTMEEAALAQRIIALQDGRIRLEGPPAQGSDRAAGPQ